MGIEFFRFGKSLDVGMVLLKRRLSVFDEAGFLEEIVDTERRRKASGA